MPRRSKIDILISGLANFSPLEYIKEWEFFDKTLNETASDYSFQKMKVLPIESAEWILESFQPGDSEVEHNLVIFKDRNGSRFVLNNDNIFGIIRTYNEKKMFELPQPLKIYWLGQIFKNFNSKITAFRQIGGAIIGGSGTTLDMQLILFFNSFIKKLGFKSIIVDVNSAGCPDCRPPYKNILSHYYSRLVKKLCSSCRALAKVNALLISRCEVSKCRKIIDSAPQFVDHLCENCRNELKELLEFFDEFKISYRFNHNLIADYSFCDKNLFEIYIDGLGDGEKEIRIGKGQRMDRIFKSFVKQTIPVVSFSMILEDIINFIDPEIINNFFRKFEKKRRNLFIVQLGPLAKIKGLKLFEDLKEAGIVVGEGFNRDSIKSQIKHAQKLEAKYLLIIGQKEALSNEVILREMQSGSQEIIKIDDLIHEIKRRKLDK